MNTLINQLKKVKILSDEMFWNTNFDKIKKQFRENGYPNSFIQKAFHILNNNNPSTQRAKSECI